MHRRILRIVSLALAILLLVDPLPRKASASESEASEICAQIVSTYKSAKKLAGRNSFSGYCATLVNWQLYLLGINTEKIGNNGNQEYDYYSALTHSSGGYRINAYSASRYTLRDALNAATRNGTKNAYNLIVCFQSTRNSLAGRLYGHAFFIHAVIDGVVYFSESSSVSVGGSYFPAGSAVSCTIDELCSYYATWGTYEGLICFGRKTYADECDYYTSNLYAGVVEAAPLYSSPCTSEVDSRSKYISEIAAGERVHVTGLYQNTQGEYWYELSGSYTGYIPAERTKLICTEYGDVVATELAAPHNLRAGNRFGLKGQISSDYNRLYTIRAQVYSVAEESTELVYSTTAVVDSTEYNLNGSALSNNLAFRKLSKGTYLYKLNAVVGNYYYDNGAMQLEWKTICLWSSQFEVVSSRGGTCTIGFDANGGTTELNQVEIVSGEALGTLPTPTRDGYSFVGWLTQDGQSVDESTVVSEDMTLCAQWELAADANGWYPSDGTWYYFRDGAIVEGFVEVKGVYYYIGTDGTPVTGWRNIDGQRYYFDENGVMQTGLVEVSGVQYLLSENGLAASGWVSLGADTCYANPDGSLCTGWVVIDGDRHYFDPQTCALILTHKAGAAEDEYVIYDQLKAEAVLHTAADPTLPDKNATH